MSGRIRLDKGELPWPPLVPGGEGLNRYPEQPTTLRRRLAEMHLIDPAFVLPVQGATHGLDLLMRRARLDGATHVCLQSPAPDVWARLAALNGLSDGGDDSTMTVIGRPSNLRGEVMRVGEVVGMANRLSPALIIVDESAIAFAQFSSVVQLVQGLPNLVVLQSLSSAYGLAGARIGAVFADPAVIAGLAPFLEVQPLPTITVRLAETALAPSRQVATSDRWGRIVEERARIAAALRSSEDIVEVVEGEGNWLYVRANDNVQPIFFARYGIDLDWRPEIEPNSFRVTIGTPEENDLVLAAMGVPVPPRPPARTATVTRDTKETRIVATLDLDRADPVQIHTGIGFYDHMLEQIARHGGFSLTLAAEGDLHIEAHHTIEDTALALGEALRQALGDRKGVARFGFVAPLDEAEAAVTLDLSGRPLAKFEGEFKRPMIGEYPTEMTAHVFRSLADAMRATIHVKVTGEDDHHKTEAAFKSFGRALRQAIRVEGDAIPSTKGVLA